MSSLALVQERIRTEQKIRRTQLGITLFNASPDLPVEQTVNGRLYVIPPNGRFRHPGDDLHPADSEPKLYDGTLVVFDWYGVDQKLWTRYMKAKKSGRRHGVRQPNDDKLILSAEKIAAHIVAKKGHAGVCFVIGNPTTDKPEKDDAFSRWLIFDRARCQRTIDHYRLRTNTFYADPRNQGRPGPQMRVDERKAEARLARYELAELGRSTFVCTGGDFDTDEWEDFEVHVQARHPHQIGDILGKYPQGAGYKEKQEKDAKQFVADAAKAAGAGKVKAAKPTGRKKGKDDDEDEEDEE